MLAGLPALLVIRLSAWGVQDGLGLAAEHGYFFHRPRHSEWHTLRPGHSVEDSVQPWKEVVEPIMQVAPPPRPPG